MVVEHPSRPPLVRFSQCPRSPRVPLLNLHKRAFASTLRDIPAAADAMRHLRQNKPTPPRTVFILDWDDTCCATSFLEQCGLMSHFDANLEFCPPQVVRYLHLLEHRVLALLKATVDLGTVLIVTNAGHGWVQLSSSRFLPAVKAFLDQNVKRVKVVSARARYIETYRHTPLQWKVLTFSDELQSILAAAPCKPNELNVFVLGDSVGDQYAAHYTSNFLAAAGMPVVMKVVKFLERPSIDQLCKELAVLLDHLFVMSLHKGPFDLSMYKEASPSYNQPSPASQVTPTTINTATDKSSVTQHTHALPPANPASTTPISADPQHSSSVSTVPSVAECAAVV